MCTTTVPSPTSFLLHWSEWAYLSRDATAMEELHDLSHGQFRGNMWSPE